MMRVRNNVAKYREKCLKQKLPVCNVCGYTPSSLRRLVVHHVDGDRDNNELENLLPLCNSCHKKVHRPERYSGRIGELQDQLNSQMVELPDDVSETARKIRDRRSAINSIGEAVQYACNQPESFDV